MQILSLNLFILILVKGYQSKYVFHFDQTDHENGQKICVHYSDVFGFYDYAPSHPPSLCRNLPNGAAVGASPKRCLMTWSRASFNF
jgi:hypothetical protein